MLLSSATLALSLPTFLACRPDNLVTAGEARLEVQESVAFTDVVTGTRATLELPIESGGIGDLILESATLILDSDTFLSSLTCFAGGGARPSLWPSPTTARHTPEQSSDECSADVQAC